MGDGIGGWDIPHGERNVHGELEVFDGLIIIVVCGMHSVVVAMSVSINARERERERESCPAIIVAEKM